jgi:hypothetical protein
MRTYCTLFDKNYLYQAVALHRSLVKSGGEFRLYALCMDDVAYALLTKMRLPTLVPIAVDELLTPEVASVRARTTHGQFCWVCQPLICQFILDKFGVDMVTYLEADSLFFSSPEPLFAELGDRSVCLVPHNFSPEFDNSGTAGKFCVQFNAFRNDEAGHEVLRYWRECCFRYDKSAPHVYPGQTTLDDWPTRFRNVAVIGHAGAGVAPWNIRGYDLDVSRPVPHVNGVPVVFFHFHQYGRFRDGAHELGGYPLTRAVIDCFYRSYVNELRRAEDQVHAVDPDFVFRREYTDCRTLRELLGAPSVRSFRQYLDVLMRRVRRRYNIYPDAHFVRERGTGY